MSGERVGEPGPKRDRFHSDVGIAKRKPVESAIGCRLLVLTAPGQAGFHRFEMPGMLGKLPGVPVFIPGTGETRHQRHIDRA